MAVFNHGDVSIYYEEHGPSTGFPVLLIAPGGMKSAVGFWESTPWNPIEALKDRYRVIAMDQRNAGKSTAPVSGDDGWHSFTQDQLALMDHLKIDRFHVAGMCIGGPYCMALIKAAPHRVAATVMMQPIGLTDNREAFYQMFDSWADDIKAAHPEASEGDWSQFRERMYGGDDFLFTVDDAFVKSCVTPILLLKGNDLYHPAATSERIRQIAPNVTWLENWKEGDARDLAKQATATFLEANTP